MKTFRPKFKLGQSAWAVYTHGSGGVMTGLITGIKICPDGVIHYMMSSDLHRCHKRRESLVRSTQGEAWNLWLALRTR